MKTKPRWVAVKYFSVNGPNGRKLTLRTLGAREKHSGTRCAVFTTKAAIARDFLAKHPEIRRPDAIEQLAWIAELTSASAAAYYDKFKTVARQ